MSPFPAETHAAFAPVLKWLESEEDAVRVPGKRAKQRLSLNMDYFRDGKLDCGTTCCIAGALDLFNQMGIYKDVIFLSSIKCCEEVGHRLGMDETQIENLFFARNFREISELNEIQPSEAIFAIRSLLDTGEVRWPATRVL